MKRAKRSPLVARVSRLLFLGRASSSAILGRSLVATPPGGRKEGQAPDLAFALEARICQLLLEHLQAASDPQGQTSLARLLAGIPDSVLLSILSESARHGFLKDAWIERILLALTDEQLGMLCQRHPDLLFRLAQRSGKLDLLRRLVQLAAAQSSVPRAGSLALCRLLARLLARLDTRQGWNLVCLYVRLHSDESRPQALTFMLQALGPDLAARFIDKLYCDAEIKVYWPLFPVELRCELVRRGRGPLWSHDGRLEATVARQSTCIDPEARPRVKTRTAAGQGSARSGGSGPRRPPGRAARPWREVRPALELMVRTFGFRESMSFREARQRYWELVRQYHPDRIGGDPRAERLIRDLNGAWASARTFFAQQAAG